MRLAEFFGAIGPFLEGRRTADEARRLLWPDAAAASPDARRLELYGLSSAARRARALDGVYPAVRREVVRRGGEAAWDGLVGAYFAAHPMRHADINENASALAGFLGLAGEGYARAAALPPFLGGLADLEWWSWRTMTAPDDPADAAAASGPLRLASTVEVRAWPWDLLAWLDAPPAERAAEPPRRPAYAVFWRDANLDERHAEASVLELLVLKSVVERGGVAPPEGAAADPWHDTVADLRAARIILGSPT